jgi:alkanesulfonate monooxygenase SsuD/methylene tetrahydromethanopterin reductase-like flavin-dependent oxidoreductase (luciferase family)
MEQAVAIYRSRFKPSGQLRQPYVMLAVNVIAAETTEEARHLFTSMQVAFVNMLRDDRKPVQPPLDDIETFWTPQEKAWVEQKLIRSIVGDADLVHQGLSGFIGQFRPDELIITGHFFDPAARLSSVRATAQVWDSIAN